MNNKGLKMLLVENNPDELKLLEKSLTEGGLKDIDLISTGYLATAIGELSKNSFDIVLLDLTLPDSHGFQTFATVHSKVPELPIVVLCDSDNEAVSEQAVQSGAQDYLIKKQIDGNTIARTIRYAVERKKMLLELERIRKMEENMAFYDSLTNLPNRKLFDDRLSQVLSYARRSKDQVAVMFLGLNGIKLIVDSLGEEMRDLLIKSVAERLSVCLRKTDTVSHFGGDEFAIILPQLTNIDDVSVVARKIIEQLKSGFKLEGHELSFTWNIGISIYPGDAVNPESLLKYADIAMHNAREKGENNYSLLTDQAGQFEKRERQK